MTRAPGRLLREVTAPPVGFGSLWPDLVLLRSKEARSLKNTLRRWAKFKLEG